MKIPFLDLHRQHQNQISELKQVFEHTLLLDQLSGGYAVQTFEEKFADYIGVSYCVGCGNGTDALEIILRALKIGAGDEVLVPANGWLSAAEMVRLVQAKPVFIDNDPITYTLDISMLEKKITSATKAIIPIHLYGLMADMPGIMKLAEHHKMYVIEDCAQAHGAAIADKKAGSWGHVAAFSFYPTKNLGAAGDAGAIVTNDADLAKACRMIANHGQEVRNYPSMLGRNSRLDSLQAAFLSYQLNFLDKRNRKRKKLAALYKKKLSGLPLTLPIESDNSYHVYHLFVVRTSKRDDLQKYLTENGIGTSIHYPKAVSEFIHLNPVTTSIAEPQSRQLLSLPLYPEMTEEEVMEVCRSIRAFFG